MKRMDATLEVLQKLKCGQNIFRRPLIEKMAVEVVALSKSAGLESESLALPEIKVEYHAPVPSQEDKKKAEVGATKLIKEHGYNNLPKIIALLCIENVRLVKEIQEHRAARGIEPLKVFEV